MIESNSDISRFLEQENLNDCTLNAIAGDASSRRYFRLTSSDQARVILMDCSEQSPNSLASFQEIGERLQSMSLSAPKILAVEASNGLMLMEDFGDTLFTDVIQRHQAQEPEIYGTAIDALVSMQRTDASGLDLLSPDALVSLTEIAFSEYAFAITESPWEAAWVDFSATFRPLLTGAFDDEAVFIHRDFHAQNLMWLPERSGIQRVGIIDFQDAMCGHPAYDLVSLLKDARRDLDAQLEDALIDRYLSQTNKDTDQFKTAYALLGFQRNLRILGVFARLARKSGKRSYLDLLPRVYAHITACLQHPQLETLSGIVRREVPEPSPETIRKLKQWR